MVTLSSILQTHACHISLHGLKTLLYNPLTGSKSYNYHITFFDKFSQQTLLIHHKTSKTLRKGFCIMGFMQIFFDYLKDTP